MDCNEKFSTNEAASEKIPGNSVCETNEETKTCESKTQSSEIPKKAKEVEIIEHFCINKRATSNIENKNSKKPRESKNFQKKNAEAKCQSVISKKTACQRKLDSEAEGKKRKKVCSVKKGNKIMKVEKTQCPFTKVNKIMKVEKRHSLNTKYADDNKESKPADLMNKTKADSESSGISVPSFNDLYKINIPLIGKRVIFCDDDTPFTERYDLARERNKRRALADKAQGKEISSMTYHEWRKQRDARSDAEKKADQEEELFRTNRVAHYVSIIGKRILKCLLEDKIEEDCVGKYFKQFLDCPATPYAMLRVPHFIHAVMFVRGCKKFSRKLRSLANECFDTFHCMFPLPAGYNFETVYTSEVMKLYPDLKDRLDDFPLEYDDFYESDVTEIDLKDHLDDFLLEYEDLAEINDKEITCKNL